MCCEIAPALPCHLLADIGIGRNEYIQPRQGEVKCLGSEGMLSNETLIKP